LDYGDTPARKGIYEAACSVVGGSISAADSIMSGEFLHSFNPGGGLHHASSNRAAGFCVFNDIAVSVRRLQKKYNLERIAIIDIDGHHGDGTQEIFYEEPLLKISFHRYGQRFFPGTGNINEIGKGPGKGYSINIPLPLGTGHESFLFALNEIVTPLIRKYKPEILLNQFGVDGHFEDPLVGLSLTTETYREIALKMHDLAHENSEGKFLIFGGGGYKPMNVAKCWAIMFITISDIKPKNEKEYDKLRDTVIEKGNNTFSIVRNTVEEIKNLIFPFHNI
jgi:acetoin utilization protein AcuC